MHAAPSVTHPVGRSRVAGAAALALWLLAFAGVAVWAWQVPASAWRMLGATSVLAAAGAIAARAWSMSPQGSLAWGSEGWRWSARCTAASECGEPEVILDFQGVMLLRWQGAGVLWFWVERRARPASWEDLRRAVYSRARPAAMPVRAGGETTP